jgi:hypothetical protein
MESILDLFFEDLPEYSGDANREIYRLGQAELVVSNGFISYNNPLGLGAEPDTLNRENAVLLGDVIVNAAFPGFELDYVFPIAEGFRLFYREIYRGHTVHSNFIEMLVTENGITQADIQFGTISDFEGAAREIFSPDEVLLTFIQRVRSIWPEKTILIDKMDLVYYQEEIRSDLHAIPYYRIFISENEVPFMINAFTNICIN